MTSVTGHEWKRRRRARIAAAAKTGATMKQLCGRFCVSSTTVKNSCIEAGVTPPAERIHQPRRTQGQSVKNAFAIVRVLREEPKLTTEAVGARFAVAGQYVRFIKLLAKEEGLLK